MFQKQLRYVQFILSFSIFGGLFLQSDPLLLSSFVGLILVWQLEILTGQLRIDTNEYYLILILVFITFSPVISAIFFSEIPLNLLFVSLIFLSLLILIYKNVNISKFGHTIFATVFSSSIVSFIMSDIFEENTSYIIYLFLSLFFLKTLATLFYVQFSNYQFFFNFFASLLTMIAISSFYNYQFLYIILSAVTTALCTVFVNFLILKIRYEFEYFAELRNEIYLYDYLIAFLFSLYFVDSLSLVNGLF
tara:strand:- start:2027 stop:2770 length:744 start_codon:yes stop_codon:yes gene_type:complete